MNLTRTVMVGQCAFHRRRTGASRGAGRDNTNNACSPVPTYTRTCTGCVRPSTVRMHGRRSRGVAPPAPAPLLLLPPVLVSKKSLSRSASRVAEDTTSRKSGRLRCTCGGYMEHVY